MDRLLADYLTEDLSYLGNQESKLLSISSVPLNYLFYIYLFFGSAGSLFRDRAFSSVASRGCSPVAVCGLLTAVASFVEKHSLSAHRLNGGSSWAPEHRLSSCGSRP